jgi:hypothetical protein
MEQTNPILKWLLILPVNSFSYLALLDNTHLLTIIYRKNLSPNLNPAFIIY